MAGDDSRQSITEEDVRRSVIRNPTREAFIKSFGDPLAHTTLSNGMVVDMYLLTPDGRMETWTNRFAGFEIYYKSNHIVR